MKNQKWINTKQKYPKQNQQCLAIENDKLYLVTYHSYFSILAKDLVHRWVVHIPNTLHVEISLDNVNFWMKLTDLPQVPKEKTT